MVKPKATDFSCSDVKTKAKDTVSSRTFLGRLLTQYFITYVELNIQVAPCRNMLSTVDFTQLFKTHRDDYVS